jgi:glycosyltransferase involved in cell wall biosynthesis
MKILMLNSEYPPLGGGQGNANQNLYEEFKKYNALTIDVITASDNKKRVETSNLGEIYFLNIGKQGKNLHFQSIKDLIFYSIQALLLAFKLHKEKKYDLIVAWAGVPAGFLVYVLSAIKKVPYIVLLRGSDVPFYEERWKYLDKLIFSWLSPIIWKNAKFVIVNSKKLKKLALLSSPKQRFYLIHNGINTKKFEHKSYRFSNKVKVLAVGRFVKRKGFIYLIEALKGLKNISLTFVGEGPLLEQLKHQSHDLEVTFLGNIRHDKMASVYKDYDIFVLPSLNEGMSNAVLEAMACGLPLILTDVGGSFELINGNGFIIPTKDSKAIRKKIEEFLEHKTLIKKMGTRSRELAENMSWSKVAQEFFKIFEKI